MSENQNKPVEHSSLLTEIQEQLRESQEKKKAEIKKRLKENIEREQEVAQKILEKIDQKVSEEEEILNSYQEFLSNLEADKIAIKNQIQESINKAAEVQDEIKRITLKGLENIKPVNELNFRLRELNRATEEEIRSMKKEIEEKFGMSVKTPENRHDEDVGNEIEDAIKRLNSIVKLLETRKTEERMHVAETDKSETKEEKEKADEDLPAVLEERKEDKFVDSPISTLMEILEKYRKYEGSKNEEPVSYFENGNRKVIDGEYFIAEVTRVIEEAEKVFNRNFDFESPQEQLSVKQKMISYQDDVRKLMLNVNRVCDKNSCSFPKYTQDILNFDVFKDLFDRVTMENWSNDRDFSIFVESIKSIRDNHLGRLTLPNEYLKSIIQELEIKA